MFGSGTVAVAGITGDDGSGEAATFGIVAGAANAPRPGADNGPVDGIDDCGGGIRGGGAFSTATVILLARYGWTSGLTATLIGSPGRKV